MPTVFGAGRVQDVLHDQPLRIGDARPSRRNFLRLRLWTTAGGIAMLGAAAVPWFLLAAAWVALDGTLRVFLVVLCGAWGVLFLPLAWLAWKILRLAWRPVVVWRSPRDVIEGERVE